MRNGRRSLPVEAATTRIATLKAELESTEDPLRRAYLQFEIGALREHALGEPAQAVREYLGAFNGGTRFRPALWALTRIFERRRSLGNLERLYAVEAKKGHDASARAIAEIDMVALAREGGKSDPSQGAKIRRAFERCPSDPYVALTAEWEARASGDRELLRRALEARATHAKQPEARALICLDLAEQLALEGDPEGASDLLEEAASAPKLRFTALRAMERLGRAYDRPEVVVRALEGQADVAAAVARQNADGDSLDAGAERFEDRKTARDGAIEALREAARIRITRLGDPASASVTLDQALSLKPDDLALRLDRLLSAAGAGDTSRASQEARTIAERFELGSHTALLDQLVGELALGEQDLSRAAEAFRSALVHDPGSATAAISLEEVSIRLEDPKARVETLIARSRALERGGELPLWRAAQIAARRMNDFEEAERLYREAADLAVDRRPILRELHAVTVDFGATEERIATIDALLSEELPAEERSALLHERLRILELGGAEPDRCRAALLEALRDPAAKSWAPDAMRVRAAHIRDLSALADAHRALADRGPDSETSAAHLCAAARARLLLEETAQAEALLGAALAKVPAHPYALALMGEMLRTQGRDAEREELLEKANAERRGASAHEMSLLLSGAAAEAADDADKAKKRYEEAAQSDPSASAPPEALLRMATRTGDREAARRQLERLAEIEIAEGEVGRYTLALAESLDLEDGDPDQAVPWYEALVDQGDLSLEATWGLCSSGSRLAPAGIQSAALRALESALGGDEARRLIHARLGLAVAEGVDPSTLREEVEALEHAMSSDQESSADPSLAYARLRSSTEDPGGAPGRPDAMLAMADALESPRATVELMLHGLRAAIVSRAQDAVDDGYLLAEDMATLMADSPFTALAREETVTPSDDPDAFADALEGASRVTEHPLPTIAGATGRALLAARRFDAACAQLRTLVETNPDDLASWEALRVAAREEGRWGLVLESCEVLAKHVEGGLRAQLLEEAGAVAMDHIGDDEVAEGHLRAALAIDVGRPIAYFRLHDLLAEADDTDGLLELVSARIERVDEGSERAKLLYERARLLRSLGRREEALASIDALLELEPDNVGALALGVEIQVSLSAFAEAVELLRKLASAEVPPSQKRVARLGAADFLMKHLDDPEGALEELEALARSGLADAKVHRQLGDLAASLGKLDEAVKAYDAASASCVGKERAELCCLAGNILWERLDDDEAAAERFRRALVAHPTDAHALSILAQILDDEEERWSIARAFDAAVRAELPRNGLDPRGVRKLLLAAHMRDDQDMIYVLLSTLVSLGVATEQEKEAQNENTTIIRMVRPSSSFGGALIERIRAEGDGGPWAELASILYRALLRADRVETGRFDVGRQELLSPRAKSKLRSEVEDISEAAGLVVDDVYQGGNAPTAVALVPAKKSSVRWILGQRVNAPLDTPHRFHAGRQAAAARARCLPIVNRTAEDGALILIAGARVAGLQIPVDEPSQPAVTQWERAISKGLGRRARRALADWASRCNGDPAGALAYCKAARRTSLRAGLMVASDLYGSLRVLLGGEPTMTLLAASDEAGDLVSFWLGPTCLKLRKELGVAS